MRLDALERGLDMKTGKEIAAINFEIRKFMIFLKGLLWRYKADFGNAEELKLEIKSEKSVDIVQVTVRPSSWPETSYVFCRLKKFDERPWFPFEGGMCLDHIRGLGYKGQVNFDIRRSATTGGYEIMSKIGWPEASFIESLKGKKQRTLN